MQKDEFRCLLHGNCSNVKDSERDLPPSFPDAQITRNSFQMGIPGIRGSKYALQLGNDKEEHWHHRFMIGPEEQASQNYSSPATAQMPWTKLLRMQRGIFSLFSCFTAFKTLTPENRSSSPWRRKEKPIWLQITIWELRKNLFCASLRGLLFEEDSLLAALHEYVSFVGRWGPYVATWEPLFLLLYRASSKGQDRIGKAIKHNWRRFEMSLKCSTDGSG